ncbi:odorant binding protein C16 precursor [Tribolium castaneum]|uniref:Odorant binding protein C16 n=1 Tax=Tribolium castaneum TaxID=7070 RepID=D2A055_TRICA|nr:odorant binding protein C16 precursor [Tribolium castaneum]EFA02889.1 odorant binding protein C16 [Tribolium castaneum]|eukprot:NP_001137375.1 odorant binding protein C16 precursor [Tribolium castaneum]
MKISTLVAILVLAGSAVCADEDNLNTENVQSIEEDCQKETGVSDESLQELSETGDSDDPLVKKNALCILKAYGVIDDQGEISEDKLEEKLEPDRGKEEAEKVAKSCAVKKDSPEETAHEALLCMQQKSQK